MGSHHYPPLPATNPSIVFTLFSLEGILLLISIFSIDCLAIPKKSGGLHRQSKAGHLSEQPLAPMGSQNQHQPEPIDRASYDMSADALPSGFSSGENDPSKQNVFFTDAAAPLPKANSGQQVGATFENIAPSYIGPNYMVNGVGHGGGGSVSRNSHDDGTMTGGELLSGLGFPGSQGNPLNNYYQSLLSAAGQLHGNNVQSAEKPSEDTINDVFNNAFKKYNVKKYLLQKIFGKSISCHPLYTLQF